MQPQRRSQSTARTVTLFVLFLLMVQLGAPGAGLAGASSMNSKPAVAGPENYDIRVNGGASLATLLGRYAPGGARSAARTFRAKATAMRAGLAQLAKTAPNAVASFSPLTGSAEVVRSGQGALTPAAPGRTSVDIVRDFLRAQKAVYGLSDAQIAALHALGESVSRRSGLRMLRLEQQIDGLPIFQSDTRFILDRDGRLVRSVGLLIPDGAAVARVQPLSAQAALQAALASVDISVPAGALKLANANAQGTSAEVVSSDRRISGGVSSKLVYFALAPGVLIPAWSQVAFTSGAGDWYTLVDAGTGTLLWRKNIRSSYSVAESSGASGQASPRAASAVAGARTPSQPVAPSASTQQARFSVYVQADGTTPADSPAPNSPTNVIPGSGTQFPEIARTIVTMSTAQDTTASPDGWIPDGGSTTTGNNVDAYLDANDDDVPDPGAIDNNGRPTGNPDANTRNRDFLGGPTPRDYTYTPAPSGGNPNAGDAPTVVPFRRGAITQLFYVSNWYHDKLYDLGFDEAAGNFQTNNFGRGGSGNDRVLAEAQDSSGFAQPRNNANFSTPPDGASGRMQMYLFDGPNPDRDGSLDSEVVIHELTHGLSNRLIGDANGLIWDVGRGMGEGWSDFYALSLLNGTNTDNPDGKYASGAYVTYQLSGLTDNYLYGIRRFPYSTDNSVNPLTWADVDDITANMSGGIPVSPIKSGGGLGAGALEVHNVGEIWALTLWEVRSRIIADPAGANGDVPTGNATMLQLTTDALKMTPLNPSVVDARDALIDADCAANACANEKSIWAGFADRGLGYNAVAPLGIESITGAGGHMGVGESFSSPYLDVAGVAVDDSAGNNNGAIDPDEPVALDVTLANPWRAASQGIVSATATISSATPGVTILDNSASYGAIPPHGVALGDSFQIRLDSSATCGQSLKFTIQTTSALGAFSTDFTLRVGTASGTAAPVTYTHTIPGGLSIPDNNLHGVVDSLAISDDFEIADLNFRIDDLTHTYTGDLTALLKGPNGYGTDLIYRRGYGDDGDNFINTVIDGQATNDLMATAPTAAPFTGSWLPAFNSPSWADQGGPSPDPVDQLSRYNGLSTLGAWRVLVADEFSVDTGKLNSWSLIVTPRAFTCAAFVPGATVAGVKTVAGSLAAGGAISYTVTLSNTGTGPQADNPGPEFTDVLSAQLTLVSASASTGTAVATVGTNTVTWDGLIPAHAAVTITINATINAAAGATIANQGSIAFDADGDGTNESSGVTDDPATAAANDATTFVVGVAGGKLYLPLVVR